MSDLTRFRDHCRRMADSTPTTRIRASWNGGRAEQTMPVGDLPPAERALWRQLADEVDAYLMDDRPESPSPWMTTDADQPLDLEEPA